MAWSCGADALLLPIEETRPRQHPRQLATAADLVNLERMLATHFQGVTILPTVLGQGLREKRIEINRHIPYLVYAAPVTETEDYFRVLKEELQDALAQETILIERHEVWIL